MQSNRLKNEKSPYLLQHADNPVDWYPWSEEAFKKAKEEDKPIFLSIGYSTCHWCHVMAHESFENDEIASLMNDAFVSIKVDREERPDIDSIYMTVCQLMNRTGGWPLTIIMTPEKKPFFAGTYIPKESRFGRMGLKELIPKIKELWNNEKEKLVESSEKIASILQEATSEAPGLSLNERDLKNAIQQLTANYDEKYGGFGERPKFPSPHNLLFLLRMWKRIQNEKLLAIVEKTLQAMRLGGIFDHIGFGFHRYSTDQLWLVPHFEKMLYDQAMLAIAYSEAYQATKNPLYERTSKEIFDYVLRDMVSEQGGFYSAEDADSEGIEGKFYVWNYSELQAQLGKEDLEFFTTIYNIRKDGNYREEATQKITGENILHLIKSFEELANEFKMSLDNFLSRLHNIRQKLFIEREKRIHPHKDDKILTDWNGLMIAALALGGYVFNEPKYIEAAKRGVNFILKNLRDTEGRLLHRFREGSAELNAFLDDYAFFIWGILNLYEATLDEKYLELAIEVMEDQLKYYWDKEIGAFYFTANDAEELIARRKEIYDGAIPSGNSVSMLNLLRLSQLTGEQDYETKADILGRVFAENIKNSALGFTFFLSATDFALGPTFSLVISGDTDKKDTNFLLETIRDNYLPNKALIFRPTDIESPKIDEISNFIMYFDKYEDKATAYICINKTCKPPTNNPEKMLEFLSPKRNSTLTN
jgi:uncharacterized protein YyaL (SSP411 family)